MRWLFLIVFSLNLAYISWQISKSPAEMYSDVPALKNVPSIALLSELKEKKQADHVVTSPLLTEEPVQKLVQLEDEAENTSDALTSSKEVSVEQGELIEKAPEITKDKDAVVANAEEPGSAEVVPPESSQNESCFTLGPFRDLDELRSLTREIKFYVVETDFRGQEESELSLYWVYIKPEKNRKKAIETGNRLKDNKIKDFYVIREGEKNNGVSLGYFRNKNGAYRLTEKVKKLGFDVIVEPVFKTYTVYWLDYQLAGGVSIPEAIIGKYIQSTKKDKISRLNRECVN